MKAFRWIHVGLTLIALLVVVLSQAALHGAMQVSPDSPFGLYGKQIWAGSILATCFLGIALVSWPVALVLAFFFAFPLWLKSLEQGLVTKNLLPEGMLFLLPYVDYILFGQLIVFAIAALIAVGKSKSSG